MLRASLLVTLAAALAGCTELEPVEFGDRVAGEACAQVSDCLAGLTCESGACAPLPPLPAGPRRGDPCTGDAECGTELVCGRQGVCTVSKGLAAGQLCGLTESCLEPLVCHGTKGTCESDDGAAGTLDFGESCEEILDCRRPYVCGVTKKCERVPLYLGPSCERSDEEVGAFRVYFELPPEGEPPADHEFYRLPFPTDIRLSGGRLSLAGHAAPDEVLGLDLRGVYFGTAEEDVTGFAPNQPVFFRFSDYVDRASLCLDPGGVYPADDGAGAFCSPGGAPTIYLADVDPDSPQYGEHIPVEIAAKREAGLYICQNWLGLAPLAGRPLRQGTTYAAILTTGLRDLRGDAPIQDRAFAAILAGTTPVPAMQPLLDFLADRSLDPATIAGAAVFTTAVPEARAQPLRRAVHAAPAPTFGRHVICGVDISPCDDRLTGPAHERGCLPLPGVAFDVLEGTYDAPAFQAGTRPFRHASDGGGFVYGANGEPLSQGTETLCFASAVPRVAPPAGGFPVVVYGHGTGGSYRSFLSDGTAERLTALGYVVVGFDNVMHGPRQQPPGTPQAPAVWRDADDLFFNLANPRASRDNVLQGAADLFHLVRLVRNPATTLNAPLGTVRFAPSRVYYFGHSQGTIISPAFLAAEPDLAGAVLSGAGAELPLSVLNKKKPIDSGEVAGLFFGDRGLSRIHPIMGVISMLFAESDSLAFAHRWVVAPELRGAPLPLLHLVGIGDSYTPDVTQDAQLRASGLPLVGTAEVAIDGVGTVASPARNNLNGVTAGAVQLTPDGDYDGHFVTFQHPKGRAAFIRFFDTARTGTPEIVK